jgi:hypothetical protein
VEVSPSLRPPFARLLGLACVAAACVGLGTLSSPPEALSGNKLEPCGTRGYSYAGFQSARRGHGVRATLAALSSPRVTNGHVAAWIGVGGVGLGPNGSNQWLQVGLNAFHGTGTNLYYEVATGGNAPRYHEIAANIAPGKRLRVAVLEMSNRPHHWRVWVDGRPVSRPIFLRGSSGRFEPIATAETWDGGSRACNRFAYRFDRLAVATGRGGSWQRFVRAHRFHDRGYRLVRSTASASFVAAIT